MAIGRLAVVAGLLGAALSTPVRIPRQTPTDDASQAASTICGDILQYVDHGANVFRAVDAYECLKSVPFNSAVAARFIEYYNTTLQFQSTLSYLKDPPVGYQQPAVDVPAELERLKEAVASGYYRNQYEFETDVMDIVRSFHDGHAQLTSGILAAFTFGSPDYITSVSIDGKKEPEIYITDDVLWHMEGLTVSPITHINGENVNSYLTRFATTHSIGLLEPHADWNHLMAVPTQFIRGIENPWSGTTTFYPGDELNYQFANGSSRNVTWEAYYNELPGSTGPLSTGGDFYNYFVLGFLPDSCNTDDGCPLNPAPPGFVPDSEDTENAESKLKRRQDDGDGDEDEITSASWSDASIGAYPSEPDIVQPGLGDGGFVTGYFLNGTETAVLSIPSFEADGFDVDTFSQTVRWFIGNATNNNISRIIIDLQYNEGGTPLLAFDVFQAFFPGIEPFAGSQRRSQELSNILGGAFTNFWSNIDVMAEDDGTALANKSTYAGNEWVVTNRIDAATNEAFSSWQDYFGPRHIHDDSFSKVERYNLSDADFSLSAFDGYMLAPDDRSSEQPWKAENIVLLTDGLCASTCVLFSELMTHQAGVKTVVVGGRPETGAMQASSGTRGASAYAADLLDSDFELVSSLNETARAGLPQVRDSGIFTVFAGFNLRDQLRSEDDVPLQFKYQAAGCRIYYTLDNAFNLEQLWRDAAAATWDDTSLCVQGSRDFAVENAAAEPPAPPTPMTPPGGIRAFAFANGVHFETDSQVGLAADQGQNNKAPRAPQEWTKCETAGAECNKKKGRCVERTVKCSSGPHKGDHTVMVCSPKCEFSNNDKGSCSGSTKCKGKQFATVSEQNTPARLLLEKRIDPYKQKETKASPVKKAGFCPASSEKVKELYKLGTACTISI